MENLFEYDQYEDYLYSGLDEESEEMCSSEACNDAGFRPKSREGYDYTDFCDDTDEINSAYYYESFKVGDIVSVQAYHNKNGKISEHRLVGVILKTYTNSRFFMIVTSDYPLPYDETSSMLKLQSWSKYDVYEKGYYYDPIKDGDCRIVSHCTEFDIEVSAQKETLYKQVGAPLLDSIKSRSHTKSTICRKYKVWYNPCICIAEYYGTYGIVFAKDHDLEGLEEYQVRKYLTKLACFRANLRHKIEGAYNLGVDHNLY